MADQINLYYGFIKPGPNIKIENNTFASKLEGDGYDMVIGADLFMPPRTFSVSSNSLLGIVPYNLLDQPLRLIFQKALILGYQASNSSWTIYQENKSTINSDTYPGSFPPALKPDHRIRVIFEDDKIVLTVNNRNQSEVFNPPCSDCLPQELHIVFFLLKNSQVRICT